MNETKELASFISSLEYGDIPAEVVNHVKLLILDTLGCGLFGSTIPWTIMVAELVEEWGGREESTIWGRSMKTPCANAALVNGVAVESFEMDDTAFSGHTGCGAVTSALAVSEREGGISGEDFLVAITAGFELRNRIYGAEIPARAHYKKGYHDVGVVFAAAASSGRVIGLDQEKMAYALAMAASQSAGLYHTTMIKRIHPGWLAHSGVFSALLAERGLRGVNDIFERKWGGWYSVFSESFDPEVLAGGLGEMWNILPHGFKYYAGDRSKHTTLHAVQELRDRHPILHERPELIDKITVYTDEITMKWSGLGADGSTLWEIDSPNKAMMSIRYCVAEMLLTETGWLPWGENPFTDEKIGDSRVQGLIRKTDVVVRDQKNHYQVGVEITLKDGQKHRADVDYPKGHSNNPMTPTEIKQKFRNLSAYTTSQDRAEEIIATVERLEELEDVSRLAELLRI